MVARRAHPPPRLHLLFARAAPIVVILRRGPAAWYHVMRWNLLDDTIEHGAWFKGRIYEERCDLSPDGELLLYFALKGRRFGSDYGSSWSALSRAPWLHALALWPQGHTWGGGGYFEGPRQIVLSACSSAIHPKHPGHGLTVRLGARRPTTATDDGLAPGSCGSDAEGRAVFVRDGKLYRGAITDEAMVADFNHMTPAPVPAPAWAMTPLDSVRAFRRRQRRKAKQRSRQRRPTPLGGR